MKDENGDTSRLVRLVDPNYQRLLSKAEEQGSLEAFLEALSCVAESRVQDDSALKSWPMLAKEARAPDSLKQVLTWLGTLRFQPEKEQKRRRVAQSEGGSSGTPAVTEPGELIDEVTNIIEEYEELESSSEIEPFLPFLSAFPIKDLLGDQEFYPIANACRTIAQHIAAIHAPAEPQVEIALAVRQRWLREFIDQELLPWAVAVAREKSEAGDYVPFFHEPACNAFPYLTAILAGEIDLEVEGTFPEGFHPSLIQHLLPCVPQPLFDVIVELILDLEFFPHDDLAVYFFDVLTSLPIEFRPSSLSGPFSAIASGTSLQRNRHFVRHNEELPVVSWLQICRLVFDYQVRSRNILDLAEKEVSYADGLTWSKDKLVGRIRRINNEVTAYRARSGQAIPCDRHHMASFSSSIFEIAEELDCNIDFDISLWLSGDAGPMGGGPGYESAINTLDVPIGNGYLRDHEAFSLRSRIFRSAIMRARQDGFYSLSEALLLFFLFTQSLYAREVSIIDWSWVSQSLVQIKQDGASADLSDCLSLCLDLAEEVGKSKDLDRLNFEYHYRLSDPPARGHSDHVVEQLLNWEAEERKQARAFIKKAVGEKYLHKINHGLVEQIVSVEASYRQLQKKLSFGRVSADNCSDVAQGYFRVFEQVLKQLTERLSAHSEFRDELGSRRQPRIFDILMLFRRFHSLPESLKMQFRKEQCRLGAQPEYSVDWLDELRNLRNMAAHKGDVTFEEFDAIHSQMYEGDRLRLFMKALPPLRG